MMSMRHVVTGRLANCERQGPRIRPVPVGATPERIHLSMTLHLFGAGLILRPPHHRDAAAMVSAVRESQPGIGRYLVWATADYDVVDAEQWCRAVERPENGYPLHVFDVHGSLLGGVGLHASDQRNGKIELGYWTRSSARGRGVAVHASRLLAHHAFTVMDFQRIEMIISVDNVASQRVAEKLGARPEGVLHDRLKLSHGLVDAHLYALLRRDLRG